RRAVTPCPSVPPAAALRVSPSFPTRRSSDLTMTTTAVTSDTKASTTTLVSELADAAARPASSAASTGTTAVTCQRVRHVRASVSDRKSTRLNSSHVKISYAVFCLKKKKKKEI